MCLNAGLKSTQTGRETSINLTEKLIRANDFIQIIWITLVFLYKYIEK